MKRLRRAGVTDPVTGELIPFPYMPRVADLPPGWRHFTTAQKIDHPIGLDRCYKIMSWGPITELDPLRASFRWQVWRVVFTIGVKAMLDGTLERGIARERDRERRLEELARRLGADAPEPCGKIAEPRSGKTGVPGRGGRKLDVQDNNVGLGAGVVSALSLRWRVWAGRGHGRPPRNVLRLPGCV